MSQTAGTVDREIVRKLMVRVYLVVVQEVLVMPVVSVFTQLKIWVVLAMAVLSALQTLM